MSEDEETGAAAAPPAGKSKVLPILLVINTLLLTGVLIFVMKRPAAQAHVGAGAEGKPAAEGHAEGKEEKPAGEHGAPEEGGGPGPSIRFDNFTVQLKSLDVDRYAHLGLEIEVSDEATKGRVEKKVAPIRDLILSYLSDRTPDELRGSDGLKQMKEAMIKNLEELIPGHRVRAVYITDFIIQ
ncbi:MAG TPA: flagellar basal body-associated FliL family protein [Polyangia bacterium]|nr:flagellar basal body-associated FliL family protein [Polyangia bacterium]